MAIHFSQVSAQTLPAGTPQGTPAAEERSALTKVMWFGIQALVGTVGGQLLGLWRVGSRYNSTIIKVGAIFVIIPLLNFVAPILILIGAYQVRGSLSKPM